jgi:alkanesulfonate monooxygenase SsuD/methylene tetrahydromethanopterin reductase-like flavin-dependent oxidoreductase (luciferase family)
MQQAFVNLRTGRPGQLPPPLEGYTERIGPQERTILEQVLACSTIGTVDTVAADLRNFITLTGADELMITCQIFDHAARLRSFEIAAQALADLLAGKSEGAAVLTP